MITEMICVQKDKWECRFRIGRFRFKCIAESVEHAKRLFHQALTTRHEKQERKRRAEYEAFARMDHA